MQAANEDAGAGASVVDKLKTMLRRAKAKLTEQDAVIRGLRSEIGPAFGLKPPLTLLGVCKVAASDASKTSIVLLRGADSPRLSCAEMDTILATCAPEWIGFPADTSTQSLASHIKSLPSFVVESAASGPVDQHDADSGDLQARLRGLSDRLTAAESALGRSEAEFRRYRVSAESKLRQMEADLRAATEPGSMHSAANQGTGPSGFPLAGPVSDEYEYDDEVGDGAEEEAGTSGMDLRRQVRQWRRRAKQLQAALDAGAMVAPRPAIGDAAEEDDEDNDAAAAEELVGGDLDAPHGGAAASAAAAAPTPASASAADAAAARLEAQQAREEYAAYRRRAQGTLQAARAAQAAAEDEAAQLRVGSAAYAARCAALEAEAAELRGNARSRQREERVALAAVEAVAGGGEAEAAGAPSSAVAVLTSSALRGVAAPATKAAAAASAAAGDEEEAALGVARARLGYLRHSLLRYLSTQPSDTAVRRQLEDALVAMLAPSAEELAAIRSARAHASSLAGMVTSLFA